MPHSNRIDKHDFRMADWEWRQVVAAVRKRGGGSVSTIIRDSLRQYVRETNELEAKGLLPHQQRSEA